MCHVLIIEDEFLIAELLASMVEQNGADTTSIACSEAQAISSAREQQPGLIVSDVNLGRGGKGPDAVAQIRDELGNIPVIFVTATPRECLPCDYATAILDKPIQPERFAAAIKSLGC